MFDTDANAKQTTPQVTHTPGPWKVVIVEDEYGDVRYSLDLPIDAYTPPEQFIANARLIAAAPELLSALKACGAELSMRGMELCGPRFTDRHGDGPRMLALATHAAAIVEKAEGK